MAISPQRLIRSTYIARIVRSSLRQHSFLVLRAAKNKKKQLVSRVPCPDCPRASRPTVLRCPILDSIQGLTLKPSNVVHISKEHWKEDVYSRDGLFRGLISAKSLWSHVHLLNWCDQVNCVTIALSVTIRPQFGFETANISEVQINRG